MIRKRPRGLFITGTGTGVGKTYVASLIARELAAAGRRVGVYKPAASGCVVAAKSKKLLSEDAVTLWEAAGKPGTLAAVCPQLFAAPLAPHLAAREEGKELDARRLRTGLDYWLKRSEIVIVEGAGGLFSPLGDELYVADLAKEFGFPLVIVAANALGVINATRQTSLAARSPGYELPVAGVVVSEATDPAAASDPSRKSNLRELRRHSLDPVLAHVGWKVAKFNRVVDWWALAQKT